MEKVHVVPTTNFESVCRTCLLTTGTTHLSDSDNEEKISLRKLFELCTNIKVAEDDSLPQTLCYTCTEDLLRTYKFIEMCKDSNIILNSTEMNGSSVINEEETDLTNTPKYETTAEDNDLSNIILNFPEIEVISTKTQRGKTKLSGTSKCGTGKESKDDCDTIGKFPKIKFLSKLPQEEKVELAITPKCEIDTEVDSKQNSNIELCNEIPKQISTESDVTCTICGKKFGLPSKLKRHMRCHTQQKKQYECNDCLVQFSNYHNLIRHKLIHTGEKPHVCDICKKGFNQRTTLIVHKRIHTGEKPFVCENCGKAFRSNTHCKKHARIHLDVKNLKPTEDKTHVENFVCNICGSHLSCKTALNAHLIRHGNSKFLCSYCGKAFTTKANLQTHHVTHTGDGSLKVESYQGKIPTRPNFNPPIQNLS